MRRSGGSTPEQLPGMNTEGRVHFMNLEWSNDDSDGHTSQQGPESDQESDDAGPRKRTKIRSPTPEAARPKWSNPDPYTSLPPEGSQDGPKKDIVKLIRKAKGDTGKNDPANALKDSVDFISLNDASEEGEASEDYSRPAANGNHVTSNPPKKSKNVTKPSFAEARYSRRRSSSSASSIGSMPAPPPGLVLPTAAELAARYGGKYQGKGRKRKREEQSRGPVDILPEWEEDGQSDPTPWHKTDDSDKKEPVLEYVKHRIGKYHVH